MPALSLDLTDTTAIFPIAYGLQPVRGWPVSSYETVLTQSSQWTKRQALAEGPWDGLEKLWMDAFEIAGADYRFHNGLETDTPDDFFPSDVPHPWTAYVSARSIPGLSRNQVDELFGIYRTLRTANYNGAGVQIDSSGNPVGGGDPRNYFFYKPNPANVAADQILRWGKRANAIVNWPAWVDWRDYNDELINWDDSKYTPRSISLTPTTGGSLSSGQTYYIRVSTIKGADQSSASRQTASILASQVTLPGGTNAFQVNWLLDETVTDHSSFRVYIGTVPGVWLGYFAVANPAQRNLLITTTSGTSAGSPLDQATAGLLRQIKRFECMPFFIPPYDLGTALDRICQISCADWQWSGLGTSTYRNDKIRFMSPATRAAVFTLNLAETAPGSFHTFPVDRRIRPNQIIVNFRDRDDEFLAPASPVVLNRDLVQEDDGIIKPFNIDLGTAYRSQAQRVASYYLRMLCDMDQMATLIASPKTYHVLPGDTVLVTNNMPGWTDVKFMVQKKQEIIEGSRLGDSLTLRLYVDGMYSDTDHSPLPRPLPIPPIDPFAAPPLITSLTLEENPRLRLDGTFAFIIRGVVQFANFAAPQKGRVYVNKPSDDPGDYNSTGIVVFPDPANQGVFEYEANEIGTYNFKVVTEGPLGASFGLGAAVAYSLDVLGLIPIPAPDGISIFWDSYTTSDSSRFQQLQFSVANNNGLRKLLFDIFSPAGALMSADVSTNEIVSAGHGLVNGDYVAFSTTAELPTPLDPLGHYWVRDVDTPTVGRFKVSRTLGGAAIDLVSTGTGAHYFHKRVRSMPAVPGINNPAVFDDEVNTVTIAGAGPIVEEIHSDYFGRNNADPSKSSHAFHSMNIEGSLVASNVKTFNVLGKITRESSFVDFTLGSIIKAANTYTRVTLYNDAESPHPIYEFMFTLLVGGFAEEAGVDARRWKLQIKEVNEPGGVEGTYTIQKLLVPGYELPGTEYRFSMVGSELRYMRNRKDLIYRSTRPLDFPYTVVAEVSGGHIIHNIRVGGRTEILCTYPDTDAIRDFNLNPPPTEYMVRVYEEQVLANGTTVLGNVTQFITPFEPPTPTGVGNYMIP